MPYRDLPAFCRVALTVKPTSDSAINVEVWLPAAWNGKFNAVGTGGWAGSIGYPQLRDALKHGFATSSTDTGHAGGNGLFALEHARQLRRLGLPLRARDDGEGQSDHRGLLRRRAHVSYLGRLLERRTPGAAGGATLSPRFRRHRGRRTANYWSTECGDDLD